MEELKIQSVNISEKKGIIKTPVECIELTENGITNDAHAGSWHRQVSILGTESIAKFSEQLNRNISPGEFAENITLQGFNVTEAKVFDRIFCGKVELEVTQIGKKCHGSNCAIFQESGNCVMPKEGVFCRVVKGGILKAGDIVQHIPKIVKIHVITLSDRAAAGVYEDKSGPFLAQLVTDYFKQNNRKVAISSALIGDNALQLKNLILESVASKVDIIFTTGGTGIGTRDFTPDVVKPLLDKEIPGIMELIRVKYGMEHPNALISRSIAGVAGTTLIYTLPGSTNAVKEYTDEILKTIEHSWRMLYRIDSH